MGTASERAAVLVAVTKVAVVRVEVVRVEGAAPMVAV